MQCIVHPLADDVDSGVGVYPRLLESFVHERALVMNTHLNHFNRVPSGCTPVILGPILTLARTATAAAST